MKTLRQELNKVSNAAPKGSHVKVSKEIGISAEYLYQIRTGRNATGDTEENRTLIQKLVDSYMKIIKKEQLKYSKL